MNFFYLVQRVPTHQLTLHVFDIDWTLSLKTASDVVQLRHFFEFLMVERQKPSVGSDDGGGGGGGVGGVGSG